VRISPTGRPWRRRRVPALRMYPYGIGQVLLGMPFVMRLLFFLYGITLGLPMLAIRLGGTVTIRSDDVIAGILLPAAIVKVGLRRSLSIVQRKAIGVWIAFAAYCVLSGTVFFKEPHGEYLNYVGFRMLGCLILYVVIVGLVCDRVTLRWLLVGLAGGTLCWLVQVAVAIILGQEATIRNSYEWKASLALGGLDANYTAAYSVIGAYTLATLATLMPRVRIPCIVGVVGATFVPVMMFSRGVTIAVLVGWMTYLASTRRARLPAIVLLAVALAATFLCMGRYQGEISNDAWNLNIRTGEGFSGRYEIWQAGLDIGAASPLLGHGFGSETAQFLTTFQELRVSHFAFLSVWIELGIVGLVLFAAALLVPLKPYLRGGALPDDLGEIRALGLAAFTAEMVYGFCYWAKVPMLCLAMIAVLGGVLSAGYRPKLSPR
jgi:O-antigen ligase